MEKIRKVYSNLKDVAPVLYVNPTIELRHLLMPSEKLPVGALPIRVSAETLTDALDIGHRDGMKAEKHEGEALDILNALMGEYRSYVTRDGFD